MCQNCWVLDPTACLPGYRFPMIIIQEVVYLRFRFNLSLRDIPDLMARKGFRSVMRRCARGVTSSGTNMPNRSGVDVLALVTNGIWMRW
jgi:hypothetical protein